MKYAVNDEGVNALNTTASSLLEALNTVYQSTSSLQNISEGYGETLGPHKSSLDEALKEIYLSLKDAAEPIQSISSTLKDIADGYQEIIENDRMKADATASSVGGGAGGGQSKWSSFFGGGKKSQGSRTFGSFETGQYQNGDHVIKGDNFEQYMSDYYDSENSTYESLGDNSIVETIPPSKIEGIHLGSTEMEDNGRFWGQHESGGTADSFKEIASHIPEVKSQLAAGKSLSDIKSDPALERCVDIYFEPSSIPRVVKSNGYYEFDSNGRHRILAARELGYDIPVRVIGIRYRRRFT